MNNFKKKIFTKLVLKARGHITRHRNNAKLITYLTLGLMVFLSIILYIPEKICELFGFFRKKAGILLVGVICIGVIVYLCSRFVSPLSDTRQTDNAEKSDSAIAKTEETLEETTKVSEEEKEETTEASEEAETVENSEEVETKAASNEVKDVETSESSETTEKTGNGDSLSETVKSSDEVVVTKTNTDNVVNDLAAYIEKYPETVGWVYFEDGSVNYPIMQCGDNKKYLELGYDGEPANTGAIFLDYRSSADFSDSNSIVYGHNMKDRTMFGSLRNFRKDPEYIKDHRYFYIVTGDTTNKYEIFAYMDVPNDYVIYDYVAEASKDFVHDAEPVRRKSYMDSEIIVNDTKKVVTLSTCTDKDELRFVVCGVLVEE